MVHQRFFLILVLSFSSFVACGKTPGVKTSKPKKSSTDSIPFTKAKILLGKKELKVWLAKSPKEQARGLMYIKKLGSDEGMLFVYKDNDYRGFWMKNTLIPLSIGFFDESKTLKQIEKMRPVKSFLDKNIDQTQSKNKSMYALEVNQGWFKKNGIKPGIKFKWLKKSVSND